MQLEADDDMHRSAGLSTFDLFGIVMRIVDIKAQFWALAEPAEFSRGVRVARGRVGNALAPVSDHPRLEHQTN